VLVSILLVPVLRAFQKFAGEGSEGAPITIRLFGPERGIRIDAESCDGQKMTAVVMPRRMVEGEINSNPA
jgi:hypothetical protein